MTTNNGRLLMVCLLLSIGLWLAACAGPADETVTPAPTESLVPEGVLKARDAVLAVLREGANECVPPKQASWTAEAEPEPPAGYKVYRFHSGGCRITITVPEVMGESEVYHVALGDGPTGFCWQAVVDANGQVLLTGSAAQTDPTLGNPAKAFCEERGYTYEVVTRDSGQVCGMCVFDDSHACNAWAFFHGACTPENASTAD